MSASSYFIKASLWAIIVYFTATYFVVFEFWFVILSVLILGIPIMLVGIYGGVIRKTGYTFIFKERGWIHTIVTGRIFLFTFWVLLSLFASFLLLIQFQFYSPLEWIVFFLTIPVFWLVFTFIKRPVNHELKPYASLNTGLIIARYVTPALMVMLYIALIHVIDERVDYSSIKEFISTGKQNKDYMSNTAMVNWAVDFFGIYNGVVNYVTGSLSDQNPYIRLAILAVGGYTVFFGACLMLSSLLIPGKEYRRLLSPVSESSPDQPLSFLNTVLACTFISFITFFVYTPVFIQAELYTRYNNPALVTLHDEIKQYVYEIDGKYYRPYVLKQVEEAQLKVLVDFKEHEKRLHDAIELAFQNLEHNVDGYLDWYYSLPGEYIRIFKMASGKFEKFMSNKLHESLARGDPFREVENIISDILDKNAEAMRSYKEYVESILEHNQVHADSASVHVIESFSSDDILTPSIHDDLIDFKTRLATAGGAGVAAGTVTAVVVANIMKKIFAKNLLKPAVTAVVKMAGGKFAGSLAGTGLGMTIGSVIPGIGTIVGGAVGFAIGFATGVSIDYALISLDEIYSREEFKTAILSVIRETKEEYLSSLKHGNKNVINTVP